MNYSSQFWYTYVLVFRGALLPKVLSLLETCFELISSPSPSMKIQIMDRKITENLGFESLLRKVNIFCTFSVHFQILHKKTLFLTIFWITCCTNQIWILKKNQHVLLDFYGPDF